MRKGNLVAVIIMTIAITITAAASKIEGITTLKDFQPTGSTDKNHKNQQYDLSFAASGKQYTCRTIEKKSLKATDFVVGTDMTYEIGGNKGKLKSTAGKQVACTIVRVADLAPSQP
ncbi:MAG: hypothetical protein ACLQFM_02655 [Terriglobales bacterium]|jgi:hypothetical protein